MNEIYVNQGLEKNLTQEEKQTNFLESNIGKAVNAGLNIRTQMFTARLN